MGYATLTHPTNNCAYLLKKRWINDCWLEEALWVAKRLGMTILFVQERNERDVAGSVSRGYKVSSAGGFDIESLSRIM
jgi:hypothetical protein